MSCNGHNDDRRHDSNIHPAWLAFVRYCRELQHGEIDCLKIQDGLPVRRKSRFGRIPTLRAQGDGSLATQNTGLNRAEKFPLTPPPPHRCATPRMQKARPCNALRGSLL
jgi:hypothetical protein